MRRQIYEIITSGVKKSKLNIAYSIFLSVICVISIIPLMFKDPSAPVLKVVDLITVYILLLDYVLRWMVYDIKKGHEGNGWYFILYPITPLALFTFISLLPSLGILGPVWSALRLFRILTLFYYSPQFKFVARVFKKERKILLAVIYIAIGYVFFSALVMFTCEKDTFDNFFHALYWATTALTTVGYGDVYPLTTLGQAISMISSFVGIAVIALPSGIITTGFMEEINSGISKREEAQEGKFFKITEKDNVNVKKLIRYLIVIVICFGIDVVCKNVADVYNLPCWLDLTGTIIAAVVLEPAAGLMVGFMNNFTLAIENGPSVIIYFAVSAIVAIVFGCICRKKDEFRPLRLIPAYFISLISSSVITALVTLWINNNTLDDYWELYFASLVPVGAPTFISNLFGIFVLKAIDLLVPIIIVLIIYLISLIVNKSKKKA